MLGIKYLEWNYFDLKKIILIQRKKGKNIYNFTEK